LRPTGSWLERGSQTLVWRLPRMAFVALKVVVVSIAGRTSLKKALEERYARQLNDQEDRVQSLQQEISALQQRRDVAQKALTEVIEGLELEVTLERVRYTNPRVSSSGECNAITKPMMRRQQLDFRQLRMSYRASHTPVSGPRGPWRRRWDLASAFDSRGNRQFKIRPCVSLSAAASRRSDCIPYRRQNRLREQSRNRWPCPTKSHLRLG
jgi:hypothetical protein